MYVPHIPYYGFCDVKYYINSPAGGSNDAEIATPTKLLV